MPGRWAKSSTTGVNSNRNSTTSVAEMKSRATACVAMIDTAMADRTYLLGDTMSAADLSICYTMRGYRRMVTESMPANAQALFDRVTELPSYVAAVKADAETSERLKG